MRVLRIFIIQLFVFVVLAEILLRVQQKFGFLDLEMKNLDLATLSDTLNHAPKVGTELMRFPGLGEIPVTYDEDGIRVDSTRTTPQRKRTLRILFVGDSFIQGYDDKDTLPHEVANLLEENFPDLAIEALNAGCSSYSPSIYIPQVRRLLPKKAPDLVVADIDETDLGDDNVRYRKLTTRDEKGHIVAVKRSPLNDAFQSGLDRIRRRKSYLVRALEKLYFTRVIMPTFEKKLQKEDPRNVWIYPGDQDPKAEQKFSDEIAYFERNLDDLASEVTDKLGKDRFVYLHHPHLQHLAPVDNGHYWNTLVADAIGRSSKRQGVRYFDATAILKRRFGASPGEFYFPKDIHFNVRGLEIYSEEVAHYLAEEVVPRIPK